MLLSGHGKPLVDFSRLSDAQQSLFYISLVHAENARPQWAKVHASVVIRSLKRDVFPTIGALPIGQLTPPIVLGVLRDIEARGAIETVKRARQRISATFLHDCPRDDLFWGYHFVTGGLMLTPARTGRIDKLSAGICRSDDFDAVKKRMARFMVAGFIATCAAREAKRKSVD